MAVSEVISSGLKPYSIGDKIRALRLRKKMGLVELGNHTGLSAALLSKLERGKLYPTLPTLLRVAMVFSVGLEFFFREERKNMLAIVRKSERQRFPDRPATKDVSYYFESLDFPANERKMNAYYAEFESIEPEKARIHQHPGIEFIYVITGELLLKIGSEDHLLGTGDSVYFDSGVQHSYRRQGKKPCQAVVVTAG